MPLYFLHSIAPYVPLTQVARMRKTIVHLNCIVLRGMLKSIGQNLCCNNSKPAEFDPADYAVTTDEILNIGPQTLWFGAAATHIVDLAYSGKSFPKTFRHLCFNHIQVVFNWVFSLYSYSYRLYFHTRFDRAPSLLRSILANFSYTYHEPSLPRYEIRWPCSGLMILFLRPQSGKFSVKQTAHTHIQHQLSYSR
jgi:hypothetical protein